MASDPRLLWYWLGIEGHAHVVLLAQALEDVPRHPEVIGALRAGGGAHLKLPLRWGHLGVDAADHDPGVEACAVVRLDQLPCHRLCGSHRAVERGVLVRVFALRPPQGPVGTGVQQVVLLLKAEPRVLPNIFRLLHRRLARGAGVEFGGAPVVPFLSTGLLISVRKHNDIVPRTERVAVGSPGHNHDILRIISGVGPNGDLV
mmetsp:Transcript_30212/g.72051  ORF Transcript_30212/g.72051 Transcript_30212/m.72051 type:complete len:202 (-) Transcript_30212:117-722(-)